MKNSHTELTAQNFGDDFHWGVSTAAAQIEGAWEEDDKGISIWDTFASKKGKIKNGDTPKVACNYYHSYVKDIELLKALNITNYRFSVAWPRIFPAGGGSVNTKGLDFYDRIIDQCLNKNITPWATLYHWDLPQALEEKGGWMNRDTVARFCEYVATCVHRFGDRVNHMMVLNEPLVSAGAGYFLGIHAPGRRGLSKFLKASHHLALSQAEGARTIRSLKPGIEIGTTFSCSYIQPVSEDPKHGKAATRVDALMNRMFLEPLLGMGYPLDDLPFIRPIEKYFQAGDEQRLVFDMDFIGLQNYTREIVKHSLLTPYVHAGLVTAQNRGVEVSAMGWEIYPSSVYHLLKKISAYEKVKKIIVTESGLALLDEEKDGSVADDRRSDYLRDHIKEVWRAKQEGVNVQGFFVWTLLDNFEWAEGYKPRFGLVHVDFESQQRTIKKSGYWYRDFLSNKI